MFEHTDAQKNGAPNRTPPEAKSANKDLATKLKAANLNPGKNKTAIRPSLTGIKPIAARARATVPEATQLWLHIHLPQLPLDVLTRGNNEAKPCVLCEARGNRRHVLLANMAATRLGVRQGMPLNAAHILGELNVFEPNPRLEQKALRQICHWALQFSPVISEVDNDGLLIEIKGSLKLFNGIDRLIAEVKKGLKELGYKFAIAVAPTPLGATALARSGYGSLCLNQESLVAAASKVSLGVLRLPEKQQSLLNSIGVRTIGDCARLPRGGVGRRASPQLVQVFDRLLGRLPDPRTRFEPAKIFQSHVELPWETRKVQTLMLAGERLLQELTGYLRGVSGLANTLRWTLYHTDNTLTRFQLDLVKASRDPSYFAMLFREKVARLDIQENIKEIGLYVDQLAEEQTLSHADLFDHQNAQSVSNQEDWYAFIDRLKTRLGDKAVKRLKAIADHRPECAWRWQHSHFVSPKAQTEPVAASGSQANQLSLAHANSAKASYQHQASKSPRPVWLMRRPVRLTHDGQGLELNGPLELKTGRERIETGWWDGKPIGRDYFVASNPAGAKLWVYRELTGNRDWYLHGIFD